MTGQEPHGSDGQWINRWTLLSKRQEEIHTVTDDVSLTRGEHQKTPLVKSQKFTFIFKENPPPSIYSFYFFLIWIIQKINLTFFTKKPQHNFWHQFFPTVVKWLELKTHREPNVSNTDPFRFNSASECRVSWPVCEPERRGPVVMWRSSTSHHCHRYGGAFTAPRWKHVTVSPSDVELKSEPELNSSFVDSHHVHTDSDC